MIRTILAVLFAAVFLILMLPVIGIQGLLRRKWPHLGEKSDYAIVQTAFKILRVPLGIRLDVIGLENIPRDRPVLYIGNHRSYLDVILTYPLLPQITGFVAKSDFKKIPVLPIIMKRLYCEFLVKDDIRQNLSTILSAISHVQNGISMFIYPEGSRSTQEDERELLEFHEGSFKIATKTKCTIIPVSINGSRERFETQYPKVRKGHVIVEFGKAIETADLTREELKGIGEKVRGTVLEMVKANHGKL